MVHSKGPEVEIGLIRPRDDSMEEHGPCHSSDGLDGNLSNRILMMSSNTRQSDSLTIQFEIVLELLAVERMVVTTVGLDLHSKGISTLLKQFLANESGCSSQSNLVMNESEARGKIHKDCTTLVLVLLTFAVLGIRQTAR